MWKSLSKESKVNNTFWSILEETENFKLQERRGSSDCNDKNKTLFSKSINLFTNALLGTVDSMMNTQKSPYRLVYEDPYDNEIYVIAFAATLEEARVYWLKILPIQKISTEIEDSRDKSMYIHGKIMTMGKPIENQPIEEELKTTIISEETVLKFKSIFNFPFKEELIDIYSCVNISKIPPRFGCLYLSKNHVSFYSYLFGFKDIIAFPFIHINDISKSIDLVFGTVIIIQTRDEKEHRFTRFDDIDMSFFRISNTYYDSIGKMVESHVPKKAEMLHTLLITYILRIITQLSNADTVRKINFDGDIFKYKFRLPHDEDLDDTIGIHSIYLISDQHTSPGIACLFVVTTNLICIECKALFFKLIIPMRKITELICINSNDTRKNLILMHLKDETSYTILNIDDAVRIVDLINARIKHINKTYVEDIDDHSTGCFQLKMDPPTYSSPQGDDYIKKLFPEKDTSQFFINIRYISSDVIMGIFPRSLRGQMWVVMSGAMFEIELHPGYYRQLITTCEESNSSKKLLEEIEKDLHRSLPEHPSYNTDQGRSSLRRVLLAYASRNPIVGYCQSMNIITAILLLYCSEEESFWILSKICDKILPNYFSKNMGGSFSDKEVLVELVQSYLPETFEVVNSLGIINQFTSSWFLTLFLNVFTLNCCLHLFDCIFLFGEAFIFQLSLSIIKYTYSKIKDSSDEAEAVSRANYILRSKFISVFDHIRISAAAAHVSDDNYEDLATLREVKISKIFYISRSKFSSINNLFIRNLRIKSQHKTIIKLENNAFNCVIRYVTRKLGVEETKARNLLEKFKEAHYKTKYWGTKNTEFDQLNSSWKTSIDYFLVDERSFSQLFDEIFKFGFSADQKEFSSRAFNLLSRQDRNKGLVDFGQFISFYNIIEKNNVDLKFILLYQMALYDSKVENESNIVTPAEDQVSVFTYQSSKDLSNEEPPILDEILQVDGSSSSSSLSDSLNRSYEKILTNIRSVTYLKPLTQDQFMQFWLLLQKLCAFEPFESNLTETITIFASRALEGCAEHNLNSSWSINFTTLKRLLYNFNPMVDLIDRRIHIKQN